MKYIKATINKTRTANAGTTFEYPEGWDPAKINIVAFEDSDNLGNVNEYCLCIIHDDAYAAQLIALDGVVEVDTATINALGDTCKPQKLVIDHNTLAEVLVAINKAVGERTQAELDMLDPEHPTEGIRNTPKFDVARWTPE